MMAFLKAHFLSVLIFGAGLYYVFRKKTTTTTTAAKTLTAADGQQISAIVVSQDPGNGAQYDTNPDNYVLADQSYYRGWYQSKVDGSWYNPSTGDFYSSGSSPVAYFEGNDTTMPDGSPRPVITLDTPTPVSGDPDSPNNPANGYVIY